MKNTIKLIICDIDRTLVFGKDTDSFYRCFSEILENLVVEINNISVNEAKVLANKVRAESGGRGEKIFGTSEAMMNRWYDAIVKYAQPSEHFGKDLNINNLLEDISKNYRLVALTDAPVKTSEKILQTRGIDKSIFHEYIGWERGLPYPKGGNVHNFEMLLEKYKVKPAEVLMIGDSLGSDIEPASQIGINTLYISDVEHETYKTIKDINCIKEILL